MGALIILSLLDCYFLDQTIDLYKMLIIDKMNPYFYAREVVFGHITLYHAEALIRRPRVNRPSLEDRAASNTLKKFYLFMNRIDIYTTSTHSLVPSLPFYVVLKGKVWFSFVISKINF